MPAPGNPPPSQLLSPGHPGVEARRRHLHFGVSCLREGPHPPIPENTDTVAWLLDRAADYLHTRGEPQPALPLTTRAHHLFPTRHGNNPLRTAHNLTIRLASQSASRPTVS